jgi:hypothetical protein
MTDVPSFRPGDRVDYEHDADTILGATVLHRFDDGYVIQIDPGLAAAVAARVLGEVNAHFVEQCEPLVAPGDALFVSGERLRHHR